MFLNLDLICWSWYWSLQSLYADLFHTQSCSMSTEREENYFTVVRIPSSLWLCLHQQMLQYNRSRSVQNRFCWELYVHAAYAFQNNWSSSSLIGSKFINRSNIFHCFSEYIIQSSFTQKNQSLCSPGALSCESVWQVEAIERFTSKDITLILGKQPQKKTDEKS